MLGLVGDHHFLFVGLLLVVEADEWELPVEIIFLLQQSVHLSEEKLFAESFTVGLELSDFIELVLKVDFFVKDFIELRFVLLYKFVDIFLELADLDVGEIAVGEKDWFFVLEGLLIFLVGAFKIVHRKYNSRLILFE